MKGPRYTRDRDSGSNRVSPGWAAVSLLTITDLRNLAHQGRRRVLLIIPYIVFLLLFYGMVRGTFEHLAEGIAGRVAPLTVAGIVYHLVLAMSLLEGVLGSMRLFVRSDMDILHALPLTNRDRFLSRFAVEVGVEAVTFAPVALVFALAAAPGRLDIALPFLLLFWAFYFTAEGVRYLVDLLLDRLVTSRRRYLTGVRRMVLVLTMACLFLPVLLRVRGVLVLPAVGYMVGILNGVWFLPSTAAAGATLALFAGQWMVFASNFAIVVVEGALFLVAASALSGHVFDYEFVHFRTQSMIRALRSSRWGELALPRSWRTTPFAELVHKDLLVLSRTHAYQLQLVVPFVVFTGIMAINTLYLHLFARFSEPEVTLFIATYIQFLAIWFIFVPAAEYCFAVEVRQEWLIRMLPLHRSDVIHARFLALLAYNGSLAFFLSLATVLSVLGTVNPAYVLLALAVGVANIAYSAAMAIMVNLISPAYVSRFLANPLATVLYIAQYLVTLLVFSRVAGLFIDDIPLLLWISLVTFLAAAILCLRLSAGLLEGKDAIGA